MSTRIVTRLGSKKAEIVEIDPLKRPTFALFGFNCTSPSDSLRMEILSKLYNIRVTSASEQESPIEQKEDSSPYHFYCDFKISLNSALDGSTVIAMLDYFWLQGNWWTERYGENWLTSSSKNCKLIEIFSKIPKLNVCFIPLDSSHNFMFHCATDICINKFFNENLLEIELIDWKTAQKEHPLCIATNKVYSKYLNEIEQKSYKGQGRYVGVVKSGNKKEEEENSKTSPYSFAVVYRKNINWRVFVKSFLSKKRVMDDV